MKRCSVWLLAAIFHGGCNFALPSPPDAAPDPLPAGSSHVLLTEVQVVAGAAEFIELWNPTTQEIKLSEYYLTDLVDYWKTPGGTTASVAGDFRVRFPPGASLASQQVLTVALEEDEFTTTYGKSPDYAIDATSGPRAFVNRSVNGAATLTDSGEYLALFYWDGESDLVRDVDVVVTAPASQVVAINILLPKTAVDGPDANTQASSYAPEDGSFGGGLAALASAGLSYKRVRLEAGAETQSSKGNGIAGDDETSERLGITWDGGATKALTAPTPGSVNVF